MPKLFSGKTNGSLTEVYFLGFSWGFKEGGTETHTKREAVSTAARPEVAVALSKFIEDFHFFHFLHTHFVMGKIFLWKNKALLRLLYKTIHICYRVLYTIDTIDTYNSESNQ